MCVSLVRDEVCGVCPCRAIFARASSKEREKNEVYTDDGRTDNEFITQTISIYHTIWYHHTTHSHF